MNEKNSRLVEVIATFFKIGCVGFGAPAVLLRLRELV